MRQTSHTAAAQILVITEAGMELLKMQRKALLNQPEAIQSANQERLDQLATAMDGVRKECITILGGLL